MKYNVGVDIGGTNIKLGIVGQDGIVVSFVTTPFNCFGFSESDAVKNILRIVQDFIQRDTKYTISSIGFGFPGDVDVDRGYINFAPNLGWKNVGFRELFHQHAFNIDMYMDNDANCATLGAYHEMRQNCDNLICLTLGTGIGGGIIIDKKLYRGVSGAAGEFGHVTVNSNGIQCECGNFGCSETEIASKAFFRKVDIALKQNTKTSLIKKMNVSPLSVKLIAETAQEGDPFCKDLLKESGFYLGVLCTTIINAFNPNYIVLSGGLSHLPSPLFLDIAKSVIKKRAFSQSADIVSIQVSSSRLQLGVIGAALLCDV